MLDSNVSTNGQATISTITTSKTKTEKIPNWKKFLTGSMLSGNIGKSSIVFRKIDSKDTSKDAKRFLASTAKVVNPLVCFVESFIRQAHTELTNNSRHKMSLSAFYQFVLGLDAKQTKLFNFNMISETTGRRMKLLQTKFAGEIILQSEFETAMKIAISNHYQIVKASLEIAISKRKDKDEKLFSAYEKANNLDAFLKTFKDKSAKTAK